MGYEPVFEYLLKRKAFDADNIIATASGAPPGFTDVGKWSLAEFYGVVTASGDFTAYADPPSTGSVYVPETSRNNFLFFINGDYVDIDAFWIEQKAILW